MRICCYICKRYRPAEKLDERRCSDRIDCFAAMARINPGRPLLPKYMRGPGSDPSEFERAVS